MSGKVGLPAGGTKSLPGKGREAGARSLTVMSPPAHLLPVKPPSQPPCKCQSNLMIFLSHYSAKRRQIKNTWWHPPGRIAQCGEGVYQGSLFPLQWLGCEARPPSLLAPSASLDLMPASAVWETKVQLLPTEARPLCFIERDGVYFHFLLPPML